MAEKKKWTKNSKVIFYVNTCEDKEMFPITEYVDKPDELTDEEIEKIIEDNYHSWLNLDAGWYKPTKKEQEDMK